MNADNTERHLLRQVEQWRERECRELTQRAARESTALLRKARKRARRDVHRAVEEERQRARRRIAAAQAELDTLQRRHDQALGNVILQTAAQRLPERLQDRWADPSGRQSWIRNAARQAMQRLPGGRWKVRHAPCFQAADCDALNQAIRPHLREEPSLIADPDIQAGLIIESGGVSLDASDTGLLEDEQQVQARLLALMGEAHESS